MAHGPYSNLVLSCLPDLPSVGTSDRTIETVGPDLAARFGLDPSCRIDAGSGDNMYGAVGTGNIRPGIVTVSLGTSGTAYTVLEEPFVDPEGEIAAFRDATGRHFPLLCVSNMANGYAAVRAEYGLDHGGFEALRCRPEPAHRETCRRLKELYEALSRRIRGLPVDDPFELRRRMLLTTP